MTIKHLVIAGGGPTMIKSIGACQHLEQNGFWKISDIESIYGTSAGAIVGAILCLKYDWETLNAYVVDRPWSDAFPFSIKSIFNAYTNRGIFGKNAMEIVFKSLLLGKDLSLDITLKEFYEYSKIELFMHSFEINNFQIESVSYINYPDLPLVSALQMTSAVPILISPVCIDGKCFIDGGVVCNYPVKFCLEIVKNTDEILGFKNYHGEKKESSKITEDSTLLDYIFFFLYKLIFQLKSDSNITKIENEVVYSAHDYLSLENIKAVLSSKDIRKEFLQIGIDAAADFLLKKQSVEKVVNV
jgi:predicted acylesterase/phospholipase RssA